MCILVFRLLFFTLLFLVCRSRDAADRKVKELSKENELLQTKLRQMQNERTRICTILDSKCNELVEQQKLAEKFKEEVNMKDVKLTWVQNKWKTEMEVHKETQQKLDKVNVCNFTQIIKKRKNFVLPNFITKIFDFRRK